MAIETKLLTKASLEELVSKLNKDNKQIYAPIQKDDQVDFAQISSFKEMTQDYINTVQSAKSVVFPRVEKLFEITTTKTDIKLKNKDYDAIPEVVILGSRPCDALGFGHLYTIFGGDIEDDIVKTRQDRTSIISISCTKCDAKCFCTSVNCGPGNTDGSDILLTPIEKDEYLAEIITEKGKDIVSKNSALFGEAPKTDKEKYLVDVPVTFDVNKILGNLSAKFDDDIWIEQSLRCIGCGSCAYVCPTCGCFDIQDVKDGLNGQRKRSWDSCGFDLFTLHTSGHNPRNVQSNRWRQRILHKFQYMFEKDNIAGCVGCGRCSRACSVDMNLKEHLIKLEKVV